MAHSHLVIRHLVKGLEARGREAIDIRIPETIDTFVTAVAELFEPFSGTARVGYECNFADDSFEISMFVGAREIVGGPLDGHQEAQNFRFNLQGLFDRFDSIQSFLWNALPHSPLLDGACRSSLWRERCKGTSSACNSTRPPRMRWGPRFASTPTGRSN